jgi:hypothetical protein
LYSWIQNALYGDKFSGKHVNESEQSMLMTLNFAICHFSSPDIVFLELPRMPPKGFITSILANFFITGIFGIITIQTSHRMWKQLYVAEIKAVNRQLIDKPIEADLEVTPDFCIKVSN